MSWKEVSPGLHQRPLGESEKGMVAAISAERPLARELIKIHIFAEFSISKSSEVTIEAFRNAWTALRLLKSPDIGTMFKDGFNQYQVPSEHDINQWLSRAFLVATPGTTTEEVVRSMQAHLEFLPVLYIVPAVVEQTMFKGTLILFISHWRTEASGCYMMIGQLCNYVSDLLHGSTTRQALDDHEPGSEVDMLVPALEDITMPDKSSGQESKARVKAHFDRYYTRLPCIDLMVQGDPAAPPSNVLQKRCTYPPEATSAIVAACKVQGFTVTAAIHAGLITAVRAIAEPDKQSRSYAALMPAQVRPRLPTSSPYRDQGCWAASQPIMIAVPADLDFLDSAQSLKHQYSLAGDDQWWYEDCRAVQEQMQLMPSDPHTATSEVTAIPYFTSLGVLDRSMIGREYRDLIVGDVWGWADPMGPGCVLTMWTFRDQLNVQFTWNASFHGDGQIQTLIDHINQTLSKELGVDVGTPALTEAKY